MATCTRLEVYGRFQTHAVAAAAVAAVAAVMLCYRQPDMQGRQLRSDWDSQEEKQNRMTYVPIRACKVGVSVSISEFEIQFVKLHYRILHSINKNSVQTMSAGVHLRRQKRDR